MASESIVNRLSDARNPVSNSDRRKNPLAYELIAELETAVYLLSSATEALESTRSELETARREKATERARYRELLELAGISYLDTDLQGRIQKTNGCTETLLSVSSTELIGKPLVLFIEESERRTFNEDLRGRFLVARKLRKTLCIQPSQSPPIPVTATLDVIRDASGRPSGFQWWFMEAKTASTPRTASSTLLLATG